MELKIEKLVSVMNDIEYGYVDVAGAKHSSVDNEFSEKYRLQAPTSVLLTKVGVCWDQVELERYYFECNNIQCQTFVIVYYDNNMCPTHTFLVYEDDNQFLWFENSWTIHKGIKKYDTIDLLIKDVKSKFIENQLSGDVNFDNLCIYEYNKPEFHISCLDFYKNFEKGKNIIIK